MASLITSSSAEFACALPQAGKLVGLKLLANENGKKNTSRGRRSSPAKMACQSPRSQSHDSGVSSHRSGRPVDVPDVWWSRVYRSNGKVRLLPYGGCSSWSAASSALVVNGTAAGSAPSHPASLRA